MKERKSLGGITERKTIPPASMPSLALTTSPSEVEPGPLTSRISKFPWAKHIEKADEEATPRATSASDSKKTGFWHGVRMNLGFSKMGASFLFCHCVVAIIPSLSLPHHSVSSCVPSCALFVVDGVHGWIILHRRVGVLPKVRCSRQPSNNNKNTFNDELAFKKCDRTRNVRCSLNFCVGCYSCLLACVGRRRRWVHMACEGRWVEGARTTTIQGSFCGRVGCPRRSMSSACLHGEPCCCLSHYSLSRA